MKKKICFIVAQPGTARSFFKDHIERLSEDFEVYLVGNIKSPEEIEFLKLDGYKSIEIERRPKVFKDMKALWQLFRYFKQENFFVVHSMASKPSLLTAVAGKMACIPHRIRIFTGQIWCNMHGFKRFFYRTIDKFVVALNTELLVDGYPQMHFLEDQGIFKKGQAQVLGAGSICGTDIERFKPNSEIREKLRCELKFRESDIVYEFMGRLKKDKGIDELLSAFNILSEDKKDVKLLLVGQDEENYSTKLSKYENIIVGENLILFGPTRKPNDLLLAADIFCMPSYREGFGLSVIEASSCELPVICSDIYGMADTFIDGVTGLKCKVKDVDSLLDCMLLLYKDGKNRNKMGKNGRQMVIEKFTKNLITDAWKSFYHNLK